MATNFITNTASLKTTIADVRKLNAKKIFVGGENILDIIKRATPTIKHSQDTRETVTENDLWGQYIETTSDGTIIVHDDWVTNPNASNWKTWNTSITRVDDNKAYISPDFYANIQTEKIKDGTYMFSKCTNLDTFSSDLSSLTNGESMFAYCSNLESFSFELPSLTDAYYMFENCTKLKSFTSDSSDEPVDLSNLTNGEGMFYDCISFGSFTSDLSNLTNGRCMFNGCTNLVLFFSDLSSLTDAWAMFDGCTKLTSFNVELPSLTNGDSMFYDCENLTSFSSNLSSLICGCSMFNACTNLKSFSSDLSSLIDGDSMFWSCTNLKSFSSDLSSLIDGGDMFLECCLDAESVMYIADSINDITTEKQLYANGTIPYVTLSDDVYSAPKGFMSDGKYVYTYNDPQPCTYTIKSYNVGKLTLGIDVTNNSSTIQQQLEDFAHEATFDSWDDLKTHFSNKGWTVTFQYGGTRTSITYGLRNGEQIIPCQIFAKLVEADKDSAKYCTEDASTFYNIEWGHDVTDTSSYSQFDSLEDAMTSWNVFPKENIISTEE